MALSARQITEINEIIAEIEKSAKPKSEIGAHDKASLTTQLKLNKVSKTPEYFKCQREYSDPIVTHFVKEKGLAKSRFHKASQTHVFLIK